MFSTTDPTRRKLLAGLGAALFGATGGNAWAQTVPGAKGDGRLVLVFLRGAYDGLSALVPYADRDYARTRPNIAIAAPDGSAQTALRLDNTFALHPALAPWLPLWQQGVLAAVPASGSPAQTRSHFDAQYQWETARPGQSGDAPGWLNNLSAVADGSASSGRRTPHALGVGEANPRILQGRQPVRLVASGKAAGRAGALDNARTRDALLAMYDGDDRLSAAFREGASSRLQSAQEISREMNREMVAADNGAAQPSALVQDARNLGLLMRSERALRLGFVSAGGWDTHANQGNASGQLANNLRRLAEALVQLRRDFSEPGDVIVVASEFGRTASENGSRGTDHGHGNVMWLLGDRVAGGRWHGQWTGLASANLHESRDVPVHHDYRAVLAQLLRPMFGLSDSQLASVLPGAQWDSKLDGLVRRT